MIPKNGIHIKAQVLLEYLLEALQAGFSWCILLSLEIYPMSNIHRTLLPLERVDWYLDASRSS